MIDDNINYEYIIRYLRRVLPPSTGLTAEMEAFAQVHQVPISQPETIALLELLISFGSVRRILEVGCAIGYSAIRMAAAGGEAVDTIEISPSAVDRARDNISRAGMQERIRVIEGDARDILPTLSGPYDMIFIDAAKAQYHVFFPECMRMLKPGGLLVSDNVLYKGMTATDELVEHRKITIVKRLRKYLEMLCSHSELRTAILPVGDGVALSLKKSHS